MTTLTGKVLGMQRKEQVRGELEPIEVAHVSVDTLIFRCGKFLKQTKPQVQKLQIIIQLKVLVAK